MREIGESHTALSTFCGLMNLPSPMQSKAFNEMHENLSEAYKQVADVSMQNAANEFRFSEAEREIDLDVSYDDRVSDITVSGDGSWQKRGHSSLNGVVTIIASDSAKCLDYRVLSKTGKPVSHGRSEKKLSQTCIKSLLRLMTVL